MKKAKIYRFWCDEKQGGCGKLSDGKGRHCYLCEKCKKKKSKIKRKQIKEVSDYKIKLGYKPNSFMVYISYKDLKENKDGNV
jgi:hypothetical protein